MNILKKLSKALSSPSQESDEGIYLYVQCNRCGERLRARVDTRYELTPEYEGNSDVVASYYCRKVLIGEMKCYQPIELRLKFDKYHRLVEKQVSGGEYITESEFSS